MKKKLSKKQSNKFWNYFFGETERIDLVSLSPKHFKLIVEYLKRNRKHLDWEANKENRFITVLKPKLDLEVKEYRDLILLLAMSKGIFRKKKK